MKRSFQSGLILTVASLILACGPGHDRADDILATAPAGTMNGVDWEMTKATVILDEGTDGDTLTIRLWGEDVEDCALSPPTDSTTGYVLFSMPAVEGRRSLRLSFSEPEVNQSITFFEPNDENGVNHISLNGLIVVNELTADGVNFGFVAEFNDESEISGTVDTTFCE